MSITSDDHYEGGFEYAAAVAAAAFAITMLDSATRDEELHNVGGLEPYLERIKSQNDVIFQTAKAESLSVDEDKTEKENDQGNEMPEKIIHPVPSSRRRARFAVNSKDFEEIGTMEPKIDLQKPSFPPSSPPHPPIKRRPTFALSIKDFEEIGSMKPKTDIQKPSFPPSPPHVPSTRRRPAFSLSSNNFEDIDTQKPMYPPPPPPPFPPLHSQPVSKPIEMHKRRYQESEADVWERAEMEKIKNRYEELHLTILEWEDRRKRKAKGKLAKTEGDSGRKRAKALQSYQDDIERIRKITEGARAQAKEKQRNEELKVKAKADKYRATGEPPTTCLCF